MVLCKVIGRRYVRVIMHIIPMYADIHRCVDMRKKEVNVFIASQHLFTIDVVYPYILTFAILSHGYKIQKF